MFEYPIRRRRQRSTREATQVPSRSTNPTRPSAATIVTILEPAIRNRLDAATLGSFMTIHAESVQDALAAVRDPSTRALLLSPKMLGGSKLPDIGKLLLSGAGVLPVAIVGEQSPTTGQELLDLGTCGVRRFVDLSDRDGWNKLRALVSEASGATTTAFLRSTLQALGEPSPGTRHFFETLIRLAPTVTTVKGLASALQAHASTLMSRFFRASLPSPKLYLAEARLVYAVALLDGPGTSIADVANRLDYSSPQSFGRHIRTITGLSGSEFRRSSFSAALHQYTMTRIVPYQNTFRSFDPIGMEGFASRNSVSHRVRGR